MKSLVKSIFYILSITLTVAAIAQQRPYINKIDKNSAIPGDTIFITGTGFSPSNMMVCRRCGKITAIRD